MALDDDLTPAERAAFLFGAMAQIYEGNLLDAKTTLDDMQDIAEKLLRHQPDFLLPEYDQPAMHWLRAILINREKDRWRAEKRHKRILYEHAVRSERYKSSACDSAEKVYLRYEADLEIRRCILRLPRKLGVVAMMLYDGFNSAEIGQELHVPAATIRKRMQSIRSPRIRRALSGAGSARERSDDAARRDAEDPTDVIRLGGRNGIERETTTGGRRLARSGATSGSSMEWLT